MKINHGSGRDHRLRYEAVFLDVEQSDLDTMNPPTETLMMGLLEDQDREG